MEDQMRSLLKDSPLFALQSRYLIQIHYLKRPLASDILVTTSNSTQCNCIAAHAHADTVRIASVKSGVRLPHPSSYHGSTHHAKSTAHDLSLIYQATRSPFLGAVPEELTNECKGVVRLTSYRKRQ